MSEYYIFTYLCTNNSISTIEVVMIHVHGATLALCTSRFSTFKNRMENELVRTQSSQYIMMSAQVQVAESIQLAINKESDRAIPWRGLGLSQGLEFPMQQKSEEYKLSLSQKTIALSGI